MAEELLKNMIEYFPIILGWLFGIFSAVIIEQIKKLFTKRDIKRGIITELKELQLRLAAICYSSIIDYGNISEDWAKWFKPYYKIFKESDEFDYLKDRHKSDIKIDNYTDKEFYDYLLFVQTNNKTNEPKSTKIYPKVVLPYLNSNYNTISLLNEKFVKNILKLQREITKINFDYEQVWFYHTKTFERITDNNYDVVVQNIEDISNRISVDTKHIILLIEKIISL